MKLKFDTNQHECKCKMQNARFSWKGKARKGRNIHHSSWKDLFTTSRKQIKKNSQFINDWNYPKSLTLPEPSALILNREAEIARIRLQIVVAFELELREARRRHEAPAEAIVFLILREIRSLKHVRWIRIMRAVGVENIALRRPRCLRPRIRRGRRIGLLLLPRPKLLR